MTHEHDDAVPIEPDAMDRPSDAPVFFDAVLTPNRSLSQFGFFIVMVGVCVITIGLGTYFFLKGAWPVLGFFGLDILLLYIAFRVSYRSGRLTETVRVSVAEVVVRRIDPSGRTAEWRFNPYWVRVHVGSADDGSPVTLTSHGARVGIAAFLAPEERAEFAKALEAALAQANRA